MVAVSYCEISRRLAAIMPLSQRSSLRGVPSSHRLSFFMGGLRGGVWLGERADPRFQTDRPVGYCIYSIYSIYSGVKDSTASERYI